MKFLQIVAVLMLTLVLGGCTFQSSTILPDPMKSGDEIVGLGTAKPVKLDAFDLDTQAWGYAGVLTPQTTADGTLYSLAIKDDTSHRLLFTAQKLTENNYLLRYSQIQTGTDAKIDESALVFLRIDGGVYYFLSGISDKDKLAGIFGGADLPRRDGESVILLDTMDQAKRISAYYDAHFDEFQKDSARIRIAASQ
jgi:hypothetical protein